MKRKNDHGFPERSAIVAFIKAHPGKVGTREIAREFGLKNADRIELKRLLRELADDGTIKKKRHTVSEPDSLPTTLVADITGRDSDGELIASPTEWDEVESGEPPKILHRHAAPAEAWHDGRRRRPRAAAGRAGQRDRRSGLSRPHHQGLRQDQEPHPRRLPQPARRRRTADPGRQEVRRPRAEHRSRRHARRSRTATSSASTSSARAALGWPRAGSRRSSARSSPRRRSA